MHSNYSLVFSTGRLTPYLAQYEGAMKPAPPQDELDQSWSPRRSTSTKATQLGRRSGQVGRRCCPAHVGADVPPVQRRLTAEHTPRPTAVTNVRGQNSWIGAGSRP